MWHKETSPGWGVLGLGGSAMTSCPAPLQAVVLEGNYWKRRIEVVMREYHKWRIYYKKRVSGSAHAVPCSGASSGTGHQHAQHGAVAYWERDMAGSCQHGRGMLAAVMVLVQGSSVGTPSPVACGAAVCSGSRSWADCALPGA